LLKCYEEGEGSLSVSLSLGVGVSVGVSVGRRAYNLWMTQSGNQQMSNYYFLRQSASSAGINEL